MLAKMQPFETDVFICFVFCLNFFFIINMTFKTGHCQYTNVS